MKSNPFIDKFNYKLALFLSVTVYFQKVLVIGVAGSLKIYEIAAMVCLFSVVYVNRQNGFRTFFDVASFKPLFWLLVFFCVCPVPGSILFYFNPERYDYYLTYLHAKQNPRFNLMIAPLLIYFYYLMTFACVFLITSSREIYRKQDRIIKAFIVFGSVVSVYSLYRMFGVYFLALPDLVPKFLDQRNASADEVFRAIGFSAEPGTYIYLQTWIVAYCLWNRRLFTKRTRKFLIALNLSVLCLTMSTMLVPALGILLLISSLSWQTPKKIRAIAFFSVIILAGIAVLQYYDLLDLLYYAAIQKPLNFFQPPVNTLDSGSMRAYTSSLGIKMFQDFPFFGVGGGNSYFFMHVYDKISLLAAVGEKITYTHFPQNSWSMILAETGIFGFVSFSAFWMALISLYRKHRDFLSTRLRNLTLFGILFTPVLMLSIAPMYNLFLWFNTALLLNEYYFSRPTKKFPRLLNSGRPRLGTPRANVSPSIRR